MKLKRLKKIKINSYHFNIKWAKEHGGASFHYGDKEIEIGVKGGNESVIFMLLCHELMEICALEMNVRLKRPDCDSDYLFVYDHRQHETLINMFSGVVSQFIGIK